MAIQFSQALIKYLPQYLGTTLGILSKEFPLSRIYLYKLAEGNIQITQTVNNHLNKIWSDRDMTADDLSNLYLLIDIIEAGKQSEKAFALKKHRKGKSNVK